MHKPRCFHLSFCSTKVPTTAIRRNVCRGPSSLAEQPCEFYLVYATLIIKGLTNLLQLFDFVDLAGFMLIFKRGFYEMHMDMFLDGA